MHATKAFASAAIPAFPKKNRPRPVQVTEGERQSWSNHFTLFALPHLPRSLYECIHTNDLHFHTLLPWLLVLLKFRGRRDRRWPYESSKRGSHHHTHKKRKQSRKRRACVAISKAELETFQQLERLSVFFSVSDFFLLCFPGFLRSPASV